MNRILLYSDEGVGLHALNECMRALKSVLTDGYEILAVKRHFFLTPNWEESTYMVVFPGGRDLPYHMALQGAANTRIRTFVERGGRYLGFCAGGYYGAAHIEFELGGELEISGRRELAFFPGNAIGPAYGNGLFSYESEAGSKIAPIRWEGGLCPVYFNGGCYFALAERYPSVRVLARYDDLEHQPAAVVQCSVGKGKALLSGVHPEFTCSSQRSALEEDRKLFFKYLFNQILISE